MSFQDFQKAPNRLTPRDIGFLITAGAIVILVLYGLAVANNYLAGIFPDGGEFYLLRTGGRAFLFDRIEPYSGSVPASVQEQVYSRSAISGEDVYILDIPFHLLILFFPLALIPDALIARVVWMALTEIAFAGLLFLGFRLLDRKISFIFIALISIASFGSFYAYRSLLEGSPAVLLGLACVGILVSLHAGFDELAGALMAVSAFQWEIVGPFLLFMTLWVFWEKRWRVFAGGGMLLFVLLVISFLLYPGWILPFLRASWNSLQQGFGFSSHQLLEYLWPRLDGYLGWALTAILIIALGYEWIAARKPTFNRLIWASCLTLAATPLLGQRVELDQLVLLTFPVMVIILISRERWQKLGNGIALLLLLFFFGMPWLVFTRGAPEIIPLVDDEILFLFWPIFAVIGLYWIRWWMIRPPRTWLESSSDKGRL